MQSGVKGREKVMKGRPGRESQRVWRLRWSRRIAGVVCGDLWLAEN